MDDMPRKTIEIDMLDTLRLLAAQLDGWHRLMNPLSPDYDPDFRPSLEAVQAAANAIAAAEGR